MAEPSVEDDATSTKESSEAAADASSGNAAKVAVILLVAFTLFFGFTMGYLVALSKEAAETDTSSTENTTTAKEPVTTTTPPPTTTNQATTTLTTTTLAPYYGPRITCFFDLNTLDEPDTFKWVGANVCEDIHVRLPLVSSGGVLLGDLAYWELTAVTDDHIYFMYAWDDIGSLNLPSVKELFDNKKRGYSLGWLSTKKLPSVSSLQEFVNVFKSATTAEDSGISLGLNLNENEIQESKTKLLSLIQGVSPKFRVLLFKLEDHDVKACQTFPYWRNKKIYELLQINEWPAPVALPVTAAIFRVAESSGRSCVIYEKTTIFDQLICSAGITEENTFTTYKNGTFGAENQKSLRKLKAQYHDWRAAIICILNMEYLFFFQNCLRRNETDFIF